MVDGFAHVTCEVRMQARGGRTWFSGDETAASRPALDVTLITALRAAHRQATETKVKGPDPQRVRLPDGNYDRFRLRLAFLAPTSNAPSLKAANLQV